MPSAGRASAQAPSLHVARRRDGDAFLAVLLQLVAQRADRDAEDVGGVGAVAEAVLQRVEDQVALDIGDGAADRPRGAGGRRPAAAA